MKLKFVTFEFCYWDGKVYNVGWFIPNTTLSTDANGKFCVCNEHVVASQYALCQRIFVWIILCWP